VLGGDDDGLDPPGNPPFVFDRDLGLAVRPEVGQGFVFPDIAQAADELVGQGDRQRHELLGFPAGVAEHQALVAGALIVLAGFIDALGDVGRLFMNRRDDAARFIIESVFRLGVSDLLDGIAHDFLEIAVAEGGDFPGDEDESRRGQRLAGDAAPRILPQQVVQHGVRDLIANFIRVTFGHRLGSEKIFSVLAQLTTSMCILSLDSSTK